MSELLPRGELATLEGLGHDVPLRAPDVVAQRVIEFIDDGKSAPKVRPAFAHEQTHFELLGENR